MYGRDEEFVTKNIEELCKYNCGNIDFSEVDKNKKRINGFSGVKSLIGALNSEINLDFIKESEILEENGAPNVKLDELLSEPDTKLLEFLPTDTIRELGNLTDEEYKSKEKELLRNSGMVAINERLNVSKTFKYGGHRYALKNLLEQAKKVRRAYIKEGTKTPLDHFLIMDTNAYLFEGTKQEGGRGIGAYRSPYSTDPPLVCNPYWSVVSKARVSDSMDALLDWYNYHSQNLHPIERAAIFHTEFVRIHPFNDGNGRTARLLTNYELVKHGYSTIIIKAVDRQTYLDAVNKGVIEKDVSDLVSLMKEAMLKSQNKYLSEIQMQKQLEKMERQ